MSLLEVRDVALRFGGVTALDGVSFDVAPGEIFAIVGPNGVGKSTLFNLISRFYEPAEGDVLFEGESILGRAPSEIAALGIARTFQNIELFEHSTVLQNLLVGRHTRRQTSLLSQVVFTPCGPAGGDRAPRRRRARHRLSRPPALPGKDDRRPFPMACARWWRSAGRSPSSRS